VLNASSRRTRPSSGLEIQRVLIGLLMELPVGEREILYLRYYEGLGPAEIAERLGVS
jgi:DNA-directed RNA polymerase specialized sigma24 family protein